MIATGVLAFGAGLLVSEVFDDDDDNHGYYYPNYGHGGMPYYPPYPYRPSYGNGNYPSNGYNRPPNYNSGFQNNGNIYVNTGGNTRATVCTEPDQCGEPEPERPNELNKRQPRPMPADAKRPAANATASNWKGQSGYAGGKPGKAGARPTLAPIPVPPPANRTKAGQVQPKVQGGYAGAANSRNSQAQARDRQSRQGEAETVQRTARIERGSRVRFRRRPSRRRHSR